MNTDVKSKKRNNSVDICKGILILLVVVGHIIPGSLDKNLARYIIYSFHMPLFIGLSGYMFNIQKVKQLNIGQLLKKYWNRLVVPWLVSVNIYYLIEIYRMEDINYWKVYFYPYYHLWFVLGFLSYIILVWWFMRILKSIRLDSEKAITYLLIVALFISVWFKCVPVYTGNKYLSMFYELIQYNLRLYYFFFFVLGMYLKINVEKLSKVLRNARLLIVLGVIIEIILFFIPNVIIRNAWYFYFNTLLLVEVCMICQRNQLSKNKLLEFIGINSYAFYLWHIIGKIAVVVLIGNNNQMLYYVSNVVVFTLECIIIYYGNKSVYMRRILFGNTN